MRSISARKINHYYKCCIKPIHILFFYYIYCIPTFLWQKLIKENHRAIKISTQHKENRICHNRTVCSNLIFVNTSGTRKLLPNQDDQGNLYINLLQKELEQKLFSVIYENYFRERKVSVFFSKIKQLSPKKILQVLLGRNTN